MNDDVFNRALDDLRSLGAEAATVKLMGGPSHILGSLLRRTDALNILRTLRHSYLIEKGMQDRVLIILIDLMRLKEHELISHSDKRIAVYFLIDALGITL